MTSSGSDPSSRFFGAALMAVGGLIAGLCGLCTLSILLPNLLNPVGWLFALPIVLLVGGAPTAIGAVIFWAGWKLFNERQPKGRPDVAVFGKKEDER